jgi:glycosyltransferase involved in cell wall biosynthesis
MKISVFATELGPYGGIERYSSELVGALQRLGHDVDVTKSIDFRSKVEQLAAIGRLRRTLRQTDLLWVLHPRLGLAARLANAGRGVPMVVSTYGFENWGKFRTHRHRALQRAVVVTAISRFTIAMMGSSGRKAVLLRPTWGVDPWMPHPLPRDQRGHVLFVSRLSEPYKGADTVIRVASTMVHDGIDFVLAGSGDPPLHDAPNLTVVKRPNDDELVDLYRRAIAVLLPSRAEVHPDGSWFGGEGFGIVLLEAARAGTPVIAASHGACPETVSLIGNGLIAEPDAESFTNELRGLLSDDHLWALLSAQGHQRAERLGPEAFEAAVKAVLAQVAEG